jgi:hypothetical protein
MTFENACYLALAIAALTWTALTICRWLSEARKVRLGPLLTRPLRRDQLRQIAEWDYGPQDGVDWERYEAEMTAPQWEHYGIYQQGELAGALSLEWIDGETIGYHVTMARKKVHPERLAELLIITAGHLFDGGCTRLVANIPKKKRAAVRLALRCGMKETDADESIRNFILTRGDYQSGKIKS